MNSRRRRILYVWDADYPWDVRTEKICRTLADAGHDVHIVARNRQWKPVTETLQEGVVHRMPPWRMLGRRLDTAFGFPAFFSPRWISLIRKSARRVGADLIIVRDLPLCPTAIYVGLSENIPVVLDMAENYAEMIRDTWSVGKHKPIDYLVRNPRAIEAIERYCLQRVSHVLTVVEESSDRIIALGVAPSRTTVVSNTPSLLRTDDIAPPKRRSQSLDIVYLGLLEIHRGIGDLVDAAGVLATRGVDFRVRIIGDGRHSDLFRAKAIALGLRPDRLEFLGRLPYNQALRTVAEANVGVIPHHATEAWNTTIPNKLFDYMSVGLAIVSSDAKPVARVLRSTGAGLTYRSADHVDFADALERLAIPDARERAGLAGIRAIREEYNWEMDADRLLQTINGV